MGLPMSLSDSVTVEAPPEAVWDLVADVTRMGEWSPETTSARWLDGLDAPVVGARFRGTNRRGLLRWSTTCTVISSSRGHEFAFVRPGPDGGCEWCFTMDGSAGATVLTESMRQRKGPPAIMQIAKLVLFGSRREGQIRDGIHRTLERVREAAEARTR